MTTISSSGKSKSMNATIGIIFLLLCVNFVDPFWMHGKSALKRIDTQRELFPQERLHVVTDRDMYCAGDTIWLRVFVTDAASLRQTDMSKYVYVELHCPFNSVKSRVKIIERDKVFAGYVPLEENLPEGDYTLLAYTAFAENVGQEYFFRKPLKILAPYSSRYAVDSEFTPAGEGTVNGHFRLRPLRGDKMNYNIMSWNMSDGKTLDMPDAANGFSRKFSRDKGEYVVLVKFGDYAKFIPVEYPVDKTDVRFYPEGGWLIAGERCTVAFKATDESGRGVNASGVLRDELGAETARFQTSHCGMGTLSFMPEDGKTYIAEYMGPEGIVRTVEAGTPKAGAAALRYGYSGSRCFFSVAGGDGMDLELVLACRGTGVLASPLTKDRPVSIDKKNLTTGLYQAILVSRSDSIVVSERLFFIGAERSPDKVTEINLDSTVIRLKTPIGSGADCSVRIVDRKAAGDAGQADIRTQMLLQSELRGRIENPAYYFDAGNREAERNLDILMMVNGWSRYNLPETILGKYAEPEIPLEIGQEITGQVRSRWRNKPLEGVMVCAISPKADFGTFADTDTNGMFCLNGFDLPEDTPFIFRAMNENGGNEGNYDIFEQTFPVADNLKVFPDHIEDATVSDFFKHSNWIMLDEINVQAFSKEPTDIMESLSSYSRNYEDFDKKGITNIEQALRGIAGMRIKNGRIFWRDCPTAYFIDGTLYQPISIESSNIFKTRRIRSLSCQCGRQKNMSGRKTDVDDAEWLMVLLAYGMFRPCYQSDAASRKLRTYTRLREQYVEMSSTAIQRMQKSLELMNVKLTEVLSNIVGVSGIKMIEDILSGERDPETLASYADTRCKASKEEIMAAVEGTWDDDYMFALSMAYNDYKTAQSKIARCDSKIEGTAAAMTVPLDIPEEKKVKSSKRIYKKNST